MGFVALATAGEAPHCRCVRFPLHVVTDTLRHRVVQHARGHQRFPFVLMLEPLYTCNLACVGCSTERHTGKLADRLPLEIAIKASDVCGAPTVSLCGGEPTLYPELPALVARLIERRRHIYLCTNGLLLDTKVFGVIPPHRRLSINVHLDGMRETHDRVCARAGVFDEVVALMREAKRRRYHVVTNTTVFKDTDVDEIEALCTFLTQLGVDGMLISPGYHYETVERDIFLTREEIHHKFARVLALSKRYRFQSTPLFLEFAAGLRDYPCSPWSTVTFTPRGWKGPCYLIGKRFTFDWNEFWNGTDWSYWESRKDALCANCAMHSGFEASAVRAADRSPRDLVRLAVWNLS
jgi:hopanoid biosynthesis associated radical SAM protein HpnH